MINNQKVIVIMPAYNAEKTIEKTYNEIPFDVVDDVVLTDDYSTDKTLDVAKKIGVKHILKHHKNMGYGANQKTCYDKAIELKADIIIMLHPDYQYTPKLIPVMAHLVAHNINDVVLGSRILTEGAIKNGMPIYKYVSNRFLTLIQNFLMSQKLSEYHTGYRCFSAKLLKEIHFKENSDDFIFDNEILAQACYKKASIGEISCPAKYFEEASSINFKRSLVYGLGVLRVSITYKLHKLGILKSKLFSGL